MNTTEKIEQWAIARQLHNADSSKQALKLMEEVGELAQGIVKNNDALVKDSIGDIYVVLTILSMQLGYDVEHCIDLAYNEIKDRRGSMVNGVFVKESDL